MNSFAPLLAALTLAQGAAEPAPAPEHAPASEHAAGPEHPPPPAAEEREAAPPEASSAPEDVQRRAPAPRVKAPAAGPEPGSPAELAEAERAARGFLEALAAGNADALAQAAGERFSFDGEPQLGRDAIRRRWCSLLAGREGPRPQVRKVEILRAAEAVARLGKPPARIASLVRPGVLVAIGDVGGRAVVLFVSREAGRMAVLGMHD